MMLYFLDIETTGLCHVEDYMLEIACVAFNGSSVVDSITRVIDPDDGGAGHILRMDDYVTEMHTKNGLLAEISAGEGVPLKQAEVEVMQFIHKNRGDLKTAKPTIAGNSIHFDRRFIREQMETLDGLLSHRMFDCSTLKMFAANHWPSLVEARTAEVAHRALPDCMESIATYLHYVDRFNPRRFAARARRV